MLLKSTYRPSTRLFVYGGLATVTFVVLLSACRQAPKRVSDLGTDGSSPAVIIQSHRGAGNLAPENTLPTFELGWELGTVPEADVRTSRDGVLVAFHDKDFARLVKDAPETLRSKGVADLTWEELAQLDVGAWKGEPFTGQRIPRLDEVFAAMRGRPERLLYLDIKDVSLELLADMVRRFGVSTQVILASTLDAQVRHWKELLPESRTLLWMGGTEARLQERIEQLKRSGFPGVTQLQIHVKVSDPNAADPFTPSSRFLRQVGEELAARGILFQSLPLNRNETWIYHRLMDLGVQSFATDEPRLTLEAMRTYRPDRAGREGE